MKKIMKTTDLVKQILIKKPDTRNSDAVLYVEVCHVLKPGIANMPFGVVITNLKEYGLPSIETVERCRRKVIDCNPELSGNNTVEGYRSELEEEFIDYGRKVNA